MKTTTIQKFNTAIDLENALGTMSLQSLGFNVSDYNFESTNKTNFHANMNSFIVSNNLSQDIARISNEEINFLLSQFDYANFLKDSNDISPSILFLFGLEDDFYHGARLNSDFLYKMYPPLFLADGSKENIFYNKENEQAFFKLVSMTLNNWDLDTLIVFTRLIKSNCPKRYLNHNMHANALRRIPFQGLSPLMRGLKSRTEIFDVVIEAEIYQNLIPFIKEYLENNYSISKSQPICFEEDAKRISPERLKETIEKYLSFIVSPSDLFEQKSTKSIQNPLSENHQDYLDLVEFVFKKIEYLTR